MLIGDFVNKLLNLEMYDYTVHLVPYKKRKIRAPDLDDIYVSYDNLTFSVFDLSKSLELTKDFFNKKIKYIDFFSDSCSLVYF